MLPVDFSQWAIYHEFIQLQAEKRPWPSTIDTHNGVTNEEHAANRGLDDIARFRCLELIRQPETRL